MAPYDLLDQLDEVEDSIRQATVGLPDGDIEIATWINFGGGIHDALFFLVEIADEG